MRIAFYVEDGLEQIVLTPESKTEGDMLGKLHDGQRELTITRGSFYDCRGGWKRYTPYELSHGMFGATERGDESTMIVLRPASATEGESATRQGDAQPPSGDPS